MPQAGQEAVTALASPATSRHALLRCPGLRQFLPNPGRPLLVCPMEPGPWPRPAPNVVINLTLSLVTTQLDVIFRACWEVQDALMEARLFGLADVVLRRRIGGPTGWDSPHALVIALTELAEARAHVAMLTFPAHFDLQLWASAQALWDLLRMNLGELLHARSHANAWDRFAWLRPIGLTPMRAPLLAPPAGPLTPNVVFNLLWETLYCSYSAFSIAQASLVGFEDLAALFAQSYSLRSRSLHGPASLPEILQARSLLATLGSLDTEVLRYAYDHSPLRYALSDPTYWILHRYLEYRGYIVD